MKEKDRKSPIPKVAAPRRALLRRKTRETDIQLALDLDGRGTAEITTGVGFLDHMLTALAAHARFDLKVACKGDLEIDPHHSVEDVGIVLGDAFAQALGDKRGIARFGHAYVPLDDALARAVIDLSGRPYLHFDAAFPWSGWARCRPSSSRISSAPSPTTAGSTCTWTWCVARTATTSPRRSSRRWHERCALPWRSTRAWRACRARRARSRKTGTTSQ